MRSALPYTWRRWALALYARARFDVQVGRASLISRHTSFEGMNRVMEDCEISSCVIGRGTYVAAHSILRRARIGQFCSIGSHVKVSLGRHPTQTFVSTHPSFFSTQRQAGFTFVDQPLFDEHPQAENSRFAVEIGHDVWVGDNVLVTDGVTIGNGAIVGAGAVVTRSLAPYSINVGIPARPISMRFDDETIGLLQAFQWWNRDIKWIREHAELFTDVARFRRLMAREGRAEAANRSKEVDV